MGNAREAALYALGRCRRFDAWSQQTLDTAVQKYSLDSRDTALCYRLCLSVLQNAALCDWYIGVYSSVPLRKMEPKVLDILRLGVCQILFMDKIPVSAAVSQAVEQAKKSSARSAGLVNAVLRRVAENRDALPELPEKGTALELSVRYSHPLWLCERLCGEFGYDHTAAYLAANNREAGLSLSVNLCRGDSVSLLENLQAGGICVKQSRISPLSVDILVAIRVTELPGFSQGDFFVQDPAAACAVICAGPKSGMRVLDGCAAPGGKSFLCASMMGDRGEIVSCDLHEKKLSRIREGADRLGFRSIRTKAMDASKPDTSFLDGFDLVLADVPCSGLGVIRKKPEIRYKDPEELKNLPSIQIRILSGLSACVRPGGTLLYSTCTILEEENRGVVDRFLREHSDFTFEEDKTIWPQDQNTDGFYYCRLIRHG